MITTENNINLDIKVDESFIKGSHCHSVNSLSVRPTAEYLQELLKDKRSLQSFPNVFYHIANLLENEINRVRGQLFYIGSPSTTNGTLLDLPNPEGHIITYHEKVFIPVKEYPNYNFVGRLLGPRGMTAKQLESELGCKIMVRGKGSLRDKKKEEQHVGKPNWEHLTEELHVVISVEDTVNRAQLKAKRAAEEVKIFLENAVRMPEGEDKLKQMQLMELALLNETNKQSLITPSVQMQQLLRMPHLAGTNSSIMLATAAPRMHNTGALMNSVVNSPGALPPTTAGIAFSYPSVVQSENAYLLNSCGMTPGLLNMNGMLRTNMDVNAPYDMSIGMLGVPNFLQHATLVQHHHQQQQQQQQQQASLLAAACHHQHQQLQNRGKMAITTSSSAHKIDNV